MIRQSYIHIITKYETNKTHDGMENKFMISTELDSS